MPVSQIQGRAGATRDRLLPAGSYQGRAAAAGRAGARPAWWRRLCRSSFAVAVLTILLVWVAVTTLLRHGSLAAVLSAGRAELAAPLLVVLVVATGICERYPAGGTAPGAGARPRAGCGCFLALHAILVIPLMRRFSASGRRR